jgi:hypothetical protein
VGEAHPDLNPIQRVDRVSQPPPYRAHSSTLTTLLTVYLETVIGAAAFELSPQYETLIPVKRRCRAGLIRRSVIAGPALRMSM